jgi:DNA-directed RNA polymerase specialized sigma24 family protein
MARGVSRQRKPGEPVKKPPVKKRPVKKKGPPVSSKREDHIVLHPDTGEEIVLKSYDQYPETIRYVVKLMYISGQAKPSELAKKFNIPLGTLRSWQTRDKWTFLKRQVTRLANKDAVKAARKAMSNYVTDIDRGLNNLMGTLNTRLGEVTDDNKMRDEGFIIRTVLEVWKMKLALFRALTYGVHGKSFYPHPANLRFDGTEDPATAIFGQNELDRILAAVPEYMRGAAELVIGIGPDDIDEDVYDAVAMLMERDEDEKLAAKRQRKEALAKLNLDDLDLELGLDPVDEMLNDDDDDEEDD